MPRDVVIFDFSFLILVFGIEFFALWLVFSALNLSSMSPSATLDKVPTITPETKRHQEKQFEYDTALIRRLIWLYLILWVTEGGLRRWFLPGLATPLLLIRDPVAVAIYFLAGGKNLFPTNGFINTGIVLAFLTFANTLAVGHGNLMVALYGVRCDFLHVPLIFIIGRVLQQKDLVFLARVAVTLAIPYTALLVAQFYAPQDAWVNRGVGGSEEGAGFAGALDRFRPPGTFSFITGTAQLYPLFTAFWFALVLARKIPNWLLIASGVAILVAIPVSVSRGLFLGVTAVAVAGIAAMCVGGRFSTKILVQALLAAVILPMLALRTPAFKDGMEAFGSRWESATDDQGGVKVAIVDRLLGGFTEPFVGAGLSGLGTGFSTNVGQKILTQAVGFGASEGEWGRLLFDNGLLLGSLLVGYRMALTGTIVLASFQAWQRRSAISLIFASAALMPLLTGQWGQASALGGTVIEAGLVLAAAQASLPMEFPRPQVGRKRKNRQPR